MLSSLLQGKGNAQEHVQEYAGSKVDKDINKMVARQIQSMEIIIEGQGYICHGTEPKRTVKSSPKDCIPAETGYLDMGIDLNMMSVIKDVGVLKRI